MSSAGTAAMRLGAVLALLLGLSGGAAWAEPWRAVARIFTEEDGALLERVRGQSSDLPVILVEELGLALEVDAQAQWRAAVKLAEAHQARAVLWFQRVGNELRVHFAEPGTRYLCVRVAQVDGQPGALEWSAGAEAVALLVRSALRTLGAGISLGQVVEEDPLPPARVTVRAQPPAEVAVLPEAAPVPRRPPVRSAAGSWQLTVGGLSTLDGYGSRGYQGLLLGAGWEREGLRLRLQLQLGLPATLDHGRAEVSLRQYAAGLWGDATLISAGPLRWATGLGMGLVGFSQRTVAQAPDVEAAPAHIVPALLMGPEMSVRWRVERSLALEVGVAAEILLGRPRLGYVQDGNFVSGSDGWAVRPRLSAALVWFP